MASYLLRDKATEFLKPLYPVSDSTLENFAAKKGNGPRYKIINGRACYTEADLLAWVEEQLSNSPTIRGPRAAKGEPIEAT